MKKRFLTALSLVFITILLAGCSSPLFNFLQKPAEQVVLTESEQQHRIAQISKEYVNAVVTVFVYKDGQSDWLSHGSGVIVHEQGFIATNYHVTDSVENDLTGSLTLKVAFNSSDNLYEASLEWSNLMLDLAIIKVNATPPAYVPMKDRFIFPPQNEALYALETVIAIGTPLSYSYKNTVTLGYISSEEKRISYVEDSGNVYQHLIQHTAPINPGNSGGGLFDLHGNLIGLNTLGHTNANSVFFAVSIYPVIEVLDKVVNAFNNNQKFAIGKFGIEAVDKHQARFFESDFDQAGVYVLNVVEGGAAEGHLQVGDVINKITVDQSTFTINVRNDFVYGILKTTAGTQIKLDITRNGEEKKLEFALA